ncbi:MAG: hypothetical protein HAW66_02500 [Shewanella sp.]|nr:hypothetical protein [Shewanella sp.]
MSIENLSFAGAGSASLPDSCVLQDITHPKLSVYENTMFNQLNITTVAGKELKDIPKDGHCAFYVKASSTERSYTVEFKEGKAISAKRSEGDPLYHDFLKLFTSFHKGETGDALIEYINEKLPALRKR